jgi:hypothetical protein
MPMGLSNAPATFQEVMNEVLESEVRDGFVQVYLDDIIIFSENESDHLEHVSRVVEKLKAHSIKIKKSKCEWAKEKIKFLGYVVENDAIAPDPDKVAALNAYVRPITLAQLWSFLGLANYNRKFISGYADLAKPLYDLQEIKDLDNSYRKKNGGIKGNRVILNWNEQAARAFENLRNALTSSSVLIMPDFTRVFILCTDASNAGYGAVLCQERGEDLKPIGFYSKSMSKAQRNYAVVEKELLAVVMGIEHFHQYLYGSQFKVFTDHRPLSWLLEKKDSSARLTRWIIRLRNYDFVIEYKKGTLNGDADALSRWYGEEEVLDCEKDFDDQIICELEILVVEETEALINFALPEEQDKDLDIKWIKDLIKAKGEPKPKLKETGNGVRKALFNQYELLRIVEGSLIKLQVNSDGEWIQKVVIPLHAIEPILEHVHSSLLGGHLGHAKTLIKVSQRFYRPFLKQDVLEFVKKCDKCQRAKPSIPKTIVNYCKYEITEPNEMITMDLTGKLPTTARGNKYIMVIICSFTKYVEIYPLKTMEATEVAEKLVYGWISRYGVPKSILSDRGTNFQSMVVELTCHLLDMKQIRTTAFHPQADGQSERTIKTTKGMIKCFVDEDQLNWDTGLPLLQFAYNSSVHSVTKQTPFKMRYGMEPRMPIDLIEKVEPTPMPIESGNSVNDENVNKQVEILANVGVEHAKIPEQADKFVAELESRLKKAYETAAKNKDTKFDKARLKNERFIRPFKYEIGNRVMINHPSIKVGSSSGLAIKYKGIFEIIGINANGVDYIVRNLNEKTKIFQIHHDRLKIYQGNFRDYIHKKYVKLAEPAKPKKVKTPVSRTKQVPKRVKTPKPRGRPKKATTAAVSRVKPKQVAETSPVVKPGPSQRRRSKRIIEKQQL